MEHNFPVILIFQNFSPIMEIMEKVCSIHSPIQNFQNIWLNGRHPRSVPISTLSSKLVHHRSHPCQTALRDYANTHCYTRVERDTMKVMFEHAQEIVA